MMYAFNLKGGRGGTAQRGSMRRKKRGISELGANEPALSREPSFSEQVERSLDVSLALGNKFISVPKLPWESGFLKDVLGTPGPFSPPWLSPLVMPRNLPLVYAEPLL